MEPNQMPPILGPTGQPVPRTQNDDQSAAMFAARATEAARAMGDCEKEFTKWIDLMRRGKVSYEDIAKLAKTEQANNMKLLGIREANVRVMKEHASEMNMSIDQMRKMPLRDLGKNFGALGGSLVNLMNPVMTLGTVATVTATSVKYVVDAMAQLNRDAKGFAVQSGALFTASGFAPNRDSRVALTNAGQQLSGMGMTSAEDRNKLFNLISTQFAKGGKSGNALAERGGEIATAAMRMGSATGVGAERGAEILAGAARFNANIAQFGQGVRDAANEMKDMPTSEATESIFELWNSTKRLGMGFREAGEATKAFQGELKSGILTTQDVAKMTVGPKQSSVLEVGKFLAMARTAHVAGLPTGGNLVSQVGRFADDAQATGGKSTERVYREMFKFFSKQFGGGTGGQMMARDMLRNNGIVPQNLNDEIMGEKFASVRNAKKIGMTPVKEDYTSLFADLAPSVKEADDASRGLSEKLVKAASNADTFAKSVMAASEATEAETKAKAAALKELQTLRPGLLHMYQDQ